MVHPSLFDEPFCVVLNRRRATIPLYSHSASKSTSSLQSVTSSTAGANIHNPFDARNYASASPGYTIDSSLYLYLSSLVAAQSFIASAHCYARPEFLGSALNDDFESMGNETTMEKDDEDDIDGDDDMTKSRATAELCRVWRTMTITLNEGRGIGDFVGGVDGMKSLSKSSLSSTALAQPIPSRLTARRFDSTSSVSTFEGYSPRRSDSITNRSALAGALIAPRMMSRGGGIGGGGDSTRERDELGTIGFDLFAEIAWQGETLARSAVSRGTSSPSWREPCTFTYVSPLLSAHEKSY